MIHFTHGDIFAQPAEAIVNPVNCVGVAGAGLALQFRRRHPDAFLAYRRACAERRLRPGRMFVFDTGRDRPRWIVHFPTKRHWRDRSTIPHPAFGRDHAFTLGRPMVCRVRHVRPYSPYSLRSGKRTNFPYRVLCFRQSHWRSRLAA